MYQTELPPGITVDLNRWYLFFYRDNVRIGQIDLSEHFINLETLEGFNDETDEFKNFVLDYARRYLEIGPYINMETKPVKNFTKESVHGYFLYDHEDQPITFNGFGPTKIKALESFDRDLDRAIQGLLELKEMSDKLKEKYKINQES